MKYKIKGVLDAAVPLVLLQQRDKRERKLHLAHHRQEATPWLGYGEDKHGAARAHGTGQRQVMLGLSFDS